MLDQIESTIKNLPSISFEEYYIQYITDVESLVLSMEWNKLSYGMSSFRKVSCTEKSIDQLVKGVQSLL